MMAESSSRKVLGMDWSKRPGVSDTPCVVEDFNNHLATDSTNFVVVHGAGESVEFQKISVVVSLYIRNKIFTEIFNLIRCAYDCGFFLNKVTNNIVKVQVKNVAEFMYYKAFISTLLPTCAIVIAGFRFFWALSSQQVWCS